MERSLTSDSLRSDFLLWFFTQISLDVTLARKYPFWEEVQLPSWWRPEELQSYGLSPAKSRKHAVKKQPLKHPVGRDILPAGKLAYQCAGNGRSAAGSGVMLAHLRWYRVQHQD